MRHFHPPQKRVSISFRISAATRERLNDVIRLWRVMAEESGVDPDDVDLSYVCDRLLSGTVDEVWAEALRNAGLQSDPANQAQWAALEHAARARTAKLQK
jgi:hypothetical protein